jgi:peptidyl-prolyl cis-trans isomerase D
MAKTPEPEIKKPASKAKNATAWVVVGMLVIGLSGFGVTNFGGGATSIGYVGDKSISTDDYVSSLRQEIAAFSAQYGAQISVQEALQSGLDGRALKSLVIRTALDNEAERVGLSVGDDTVAKELRAQPPLQGVSGTFDRELYRSLLKRQKISEAEFENGLRRDVARSLLQGAVAGGFATPKALTETIYGYFGERRGFSMLRLTESDLTTPLATPTDDELKAHYDANIATFTKPESKRITYVSLLPETIAKDQPVDEALLKEMYDQRIDEFVVPERRLVERLIYPDQAAADAAKARLDAGETFEKLVTDRGLTLDAIDLGDVAKEDLGAAGEAVFAGTEAGIVGPVTTDLGPALFRINGVLAKEETTFEDAREALAIELQTDAARRAIADQIEAMDDLLAGGAELKDLEKELGMTLATIDYVPGQQGEDVIEGYTAFRTAADAVAADDFPEAIVLEDGGVVALQLDEIVPPAPIPFEEARDSVAAAWTAEALAKALSARGAEIKAALEGGADIGSFGIVDVTPETSREGYIDGAPPTLKTAVFEMAKGDVRVIEDKDFAAVVQLNEVLPAAEDGEDATAGRETISAQLEQNISRDAFSAFTQALIDEAGLSTNQSAINAVHSSMQ